MTHLHCRLCQRLVKRKSPSRESALCRACGDEGVCNDETDPDSDSGCVLQIYHDGSHMSISGRTWIKSGVQEARKT